MPEIRQRVRPIEVTYICDACGKGMMTAVGEMDPQSGDIEHHCVICNHSQTFKWRPYPHIDYVEIESDR